MIESDFQTQLCLRFSRLLLHTSFFPLRHEILACLCPIEMASQTLLSLCCHFGTILFFLLAAFPCIQYNSLQFHTSCSLAYHLSSHLHFLCYPASTFFCPPTFTTIQTLKQIHKNIMIPFSSSKFTFNIFTKNLPHANTASQHVDLRVSLFLHISLLSICLCKMHIFLGASSVLLFSL